MKQRCWRCDRRIAITSGAVCTVAGWAHDPCPKPPKRRRIAEDAIRRIVREELERERQGREFR